MVVEEGEEEEEEEVVVAAWIVPRELSEVSGGVVYTSSESPPPTLQPSLAAPSTQLTLTQPSLRPGPIITPTIVFGICEEGLGLTQAPVSQNHTRAA